MLRQQIYSVMLLILDDASEVPRLLIHSSLRLGLPLTDNPRDLSAGSIRQVIGSNLIVIATPGVCIVWDFMAKTVVSSPWRQHQVNHLADAPIRIE